MKKRIFVGLFMTAVLVFTSCSSSQFSVRYVDIHETDIITMPKVADYEVNIGKKLTGTVKMSNKNGMDYIKSSAIAVALASDPTADLLVDPMYTIKKGILKTEVTVVGYYGKYTSIETIDTAEILYYMQFNSAMRVNNAMGGGAGRGIQLFKR